MDKFTTNVQVEEDKAYQEWLDVQEVADMKAFAKITKPSELEDKPQAGKIYSLFGGKGEPCIAAGNTWAESEVKEN